MKASIHKLPPLDTSGRNARRGFTYQDHVGVSLCIEMLLSSEISQIWFEREDDITVIRYISKEEHVEFIQVKHNLDKPSRWSISDITQRKKDKVGTSIFEKLLTMDRCEEKCSFHIATSYDVVKSELGYLILLRDSQDRINNANAKKEILAELNRRLPGVTSPNGKNWEDFIDKCQWTKFPDSIEDLKSVNILKLEKVFRDLKTTVLPDQRDEIYQKLLALVQDASVKDLTLDPDCYKIRKEHLFKWLNEKIDNLNLTHNDYPLELKMSSAGISPDLIKGASLIKVRYKSKRLVDSYNFKADYDELEDEIVFKLHELKIALDSGVLNLGGPEFLNYCIGEVTKIVEKYSLRKNNIPNYFGAGLMYDITNRCIHRFNKAQP